jgi:hypothetical protein
MDKPVSPVWISLDVAVPERGEVVIVRTYDPQDGRTGTGVNFALQCEECDLWHSLEGGTLMPPARVTHWSPMPIDAASNPNLN